MASGAAFAQDTTDTQEAEAAEPTEKTPRKDWLRGSLETRMDFQSADDETDFELDQFLRFRFQVRQQPELLQHARLKVLRFVDDDDHPVPFFSFLK